MMEGSNDSNTTSTTASTTASVDGGGVKSPATTPSRSPPPAHPHPLPSLLPQTQQKLASRLSAPNSGPGSAAASPRVSRSTSPLRQQPLTAAPSTQPSAAAIQRALSAAATTPRFTPLSSTENPSAAPRRSITAAIGEAAAAAASAAAAVAPQWPVSPRLKSPSPSDGSRRRISVANARKSDGSAPANNGCTDSINSATATPAATPRLSGPDDTLRLAPPPVKSASRGPSGKMTLATVQENGSDEVKGLGLIDEESPTDTTTTTSSPPNGQRSHRPTAYDCTNSAPTESGSDSAGKADKSRTRRVASPTSSSTPSIAAPSKPPAATPTRTKSNTKLATVKSRQPEGKQGMTVETETVASIPQSAISTGDRSSSRTDASNGAGSIRLRPSNETIRPKKERKKASHKPRSINQSNASSKADIFEARVASAVDEVNSSDSDETYVYESNPPETRRRPRHHSRTPSVTSSHSTADQGRGGIRTFTDNGDERRVAGKRSMKFSNNFNNDRETQDGSIRSYQPRHIGRFGRGGNQAAAFDPDSPYTQASKLRPGQWGSQRRSPHSPNSNSGFSQQQQHHQFSSSAFFGKKQEPPYDMEEQGADDERLPLMGTVRTGRNNGRYARRMHIGAGAGAGGYGSDGYYVPRRRSHFRRYAGCLLALFVFIVVVLSAIGVLVMSNRPLYDVELLRVQNVLASEQELMLDLHVTAVNPNAIGITISDIDLDVFAHSRYVGSDRFWREHGFPDPPDSGLEPPNPESGDSDPDDYDNDPDAFERSIDPRRPHTGDGVDKGTDPPDYDLPERDAQTMFLGRIFQFDQALSFDGSPLKHHPHRSIGTLRLHRPGNKTETGGSVRWERVLLHPFDLIVRGSLQYRLPVSQRRMTVSVDGEVRVYPDDDEEEDPVEKHGGKMVSVRW